MASIYQPSHSAGNLDVKMGNLYTDLFISKIKIADTGGEA